MKFTSIAFRIISFLLIILFVLVIGYFVRLPFTPTHTPSLATTTLSSVSTSTTTVEFDFQSVQVDTSDWLTYRNPAYGYEFKYPKGWVEVDYYKYLTNINDITVEKKRITDHKISGFSPKDQNSPSGLPYVGISLYKGKDFGLHDLLTEITPQIDTGHLLTQFVINDNTIVIFTSYVPPNTTGYINNIADVQIWLVTKNDEVYSVDGLHGEGAGYYPDSLMYVTGVYRTFKSL